MVNLRPLSIHRRGRLQVARRRSAPSVGQEQGPAGDVSGGQSPVDAETSGPHLAAVRVPAARAAMSLRWTADVATFSWTASRLPCSR